MIKQMQTLLRVKELKQDQAFRTMQLKRQQVKTAQAATLRAEESVAESRRTFRAREDAIFDEIMGSIVDLGGIDAVHGRVLLLEKVHQGLVDKLERARHVQHRLEGELAESTAVYRGAVKVRDKYVIITDDMRQRADKDAEEREELEVEDLFSRPAPRAA